MRTRNETRKKKDRHTAGLIFIIALLFVLAGYFLLFWGEEEEAEEETTPAVTANICSAPVLAPPRAAPEPPVPVAESAPPDPLESPESPELSESSEPLAFPGSELPAPSKPSAPPEPPILYPIAPETSSVPLPELEKSDAPVREALGKVMGKSGGLLMMSEELIYHIVITIDNLPRKQLPARVVPLKRAADIFVTEGKDETLAIGAQNARRYAAYVTAAQTTDSAKLVTLYRHFYPLFQKAYRELGYPRGNFNDRLVVAIDDLLAAPDPAPPIRLTQPKVLFEYADPELENRSAGQKIMIRIGRENAATIKAKLHEIRREITR